MSARRAMQKALAVGLLIVGGRVGAGEISYKDGQATVEFENGQIRFTNRLQLRYTLQLPDEDATLPGGDGPGRAKSSFRLRRYEPQFSGWIYGRALTYKLEFAFQDLQGGASGGALNDAYVNYDFSGAQGRLRAQLGQFKVPFGRQELTSSFALQFVDRSLVAGEFQKGRDLGVQLDGLLLGKKLAWAVGAFNGNGRNTVANDDARLQYDVRVVYQPWGDTRYSEGDFESTGKPLLALAGQYEHGSALDPSGRRGPERQVLGADVVLKRRGLFLQAEYFHRTLTTSGGARTGSEGYDLQAGYGLGSARRWQVALRYALFDPAGERPRDERRELGGALNWFYNRHAAKLQADFRRIDDRAKGTRDHELRFQAQLAF